jgi:hypothetical protein
MKIISDKFPTNIPQILAPFISAIFLSYYLTGLILEMKFGRPSSTSAIGFVFIPVYAIFLLLLGYAAGLLVRSIVSRFTVERTISKKTIYSIYAAFLVAVLASSIAGGVSFKIYEDAQKPHVIINSAAVIKLPDGQYEDSNQVDAKFLLSIFDDDKIKNGTLPWNSRIIRFKLFKDANSLVVLDDAGAQLMQIDLNAFDYITRVYAVPVTTNDSMKKGLAVLVNLRSTSRRSVLLIYNADNKLLYQELLYRVRIDNLMKTVKDKSGKEYLWLNLDTPQIYSFNTVVS